MGYLRFLFVALILTGPVAARSQTPDICTDLWLSRVLLLDRAGECLIDPLAERLFGAPCAQDISKAGAADQNALAAIRRRETALDCNGPDERALRLLRPDLRSRLETLPIPVTAPTGCLYWQGEPVYLSAAPDESAAILGAAEWGDDVFFEHDSLEPRGDWRFVTVYLDGQLTGLGWTRGLRTLEDCGGLID